ncbi:MAG: hypothetical protein SPI30_03450 [Prevotella sp.]|nr:hypothetical protein [Prevotella sp.]
MTVYNRRYIGLPRGKTAEKTLASERKQSGSNIISEECSLAGLMADWGSW